MRIVVTGSHGQVARSLLEIGPSRGHEIVTVGRPDFDLGGDEATIIAALMRAKPGAIVSAAAYTAVDKAESEPALAEAINARGPAAVARAAAKLDVPLVHLSTDYVFDGQKTSPYVETDEARPAGAYGASKLRGEEAILREHGNSAILRCAWIYSPFGSNFVRTMLRLAAERDEIEVVADQVGNPTSALEIATGALRVAENLAKGTVEAQRGVFHMTGKGETSWAGFAEAIFAESKAAGGPSAQVRHITTAQFPTPAARPANSRLDNTLLGHTHGVRLPAWQTSLAAVVHRLI